LHKTIRVTASPLRHMKREDQQCPLGYVVPWIFYLPKTDK
jgi:hypothetical protein